MTFNELNLHEHLLRAIEKAGFEAPTPVQEQSIPHIMEGGDLMACAQTGTGKTAAFTLPVAHRLMTTKRTAEKPNGPRALVLTPTRELADQVLTNIKTFIGGSWLKAGLVVGGVSYTPQIKMLQKPLDILVATPGRLMDHMREGRVDLSQVEIVILDEADRMLDMGFSKPVETIVSEIVGTPQTLLFSATFDNEVEKLAKKYLTDPKEVRLAASTKRHESIDQSMYFTKGREQKMEIMEGILSDPKVWQAIVFMRTKFATERMAKQIESWGHTASALHGDMRQNARKRVVERMHKGNLRVLVATDVAARGLDLKDLTHVINFDLPQVAEDYIHRIGRTGRAGAEGVAVSFVSRDEMHLLRGIEKLLGEKIHAENDMPAKAKLKNKDGGKGKPRGDRKPSKPRNAGPRKEREEGQEEFSEKPRRAAKPKREVGSWSKDKPRRDAKGNRDNKWNKDSSDKPRRDGDKPRGKWSKGGDSKPNRGPKREGGNWAEKPKRDADGNKKWSKSGDDKPRRDGDKPRGKWSKGGDDKPRRNPGEKVRGSWMKDKDRDSEEKPRSAHTRARTGNWQKKKAAGKSKPNFGGNRGPAGGAPKKPSGPRRNAN